jgi:transcriptional regulator GlxA family with amidase domain
MEQTVAVLALPGVVPLDLAAPVQVFGGWSGSPYRVRVCAAEPSVRTSAGFGIIPHGGLELLREAGTVVVPGFVPHTAPVGGEVAAALRAAHRGGARVMSICTGAFALAAVGLLDGRPATTHWQHAAELAAAHPRVRVRPDVLYVDDGDVLTSAGVSAGIDLCLHVVRRDLGAATARLVARAIVAAPHRDGNQAQFVDRPIEPARGNPFAELCDWAAGHLDADLSLAALARRCAMSERTLSRRFRDSTGTTPAQWVLNARLDRARRLLEQTALSTEQVAARCGFGTVWDWGKRAECAGCA